MNWVTENTVKNSGLSSCVGPSFQAYAAKYRNRSDQQSARKQWSGVARGLKFVISVQGNDWERFLYLAACISG